MVLTPLVAELTIPPEARVATLTPWHSAACLMRLDNSRLLLNVNNFLLLLCGLCDLNSELNGSPVEEIVSPCNIIW